MSDFARNLSYLFERSPCVSQDSFAHNLGINRSTLSRLMTGSRNPKKSHLLKIAAYAGLNEADMLLLDHDAFRQTIKGEEVKTDLILVSLRSIRKNLSRSSATFSIYKGQYIIYYVGTDQTIGSLLTIQRTTPEGIRFQLLNPYREATGEWGAFDYAGYMYPVGDFLYLLGEQSEKDYEIISLIFQSSPSPKVGALRGIITGIGVRHDRSYIAARPFIAIRRQKLIDDWRKALGKELGYLTQAQLPQLVRQELSEEKITLR